MPANRTRRSVDVRLNDEQMSKLSDLSNLWGGIMPLPISDVIRECLERTYRAEMAMRGRDLAASEKPSKTP